LTEKDKIGLTAASVVTSPLTKIVRYDQNKALISCHLADRSRRLQDSMKPDLTGSLIY
jgi:hypothetical protein